MSGLPISSRLAARTMPCLTRRFLLPAILLIGVGLGPVLPAAADELPGEQSMRSAMLFNFLKFIEFPRLGVDKSRDIQICISVRDNIQAAALAALSGRKVAGRELLIVDFVMRSGDCQVLYVDSRQRWNALATHPALRGALTISAYSGFADEGGMIEIGRLDDGIRFDVNLAQARRAGFHFSPQMLLLARKVHE